MATRDELEAAWHYAEASRYAEHERERLFALMVDGQTLAEAAALVRPPADPLETLFARKPQPPPTGAANDPTH